MDQSRHARNAPTQDPLSGRIWVGISWDSMVIQMDFTTQQIGSYWETYPSGNWLKNGDSDSYVSLLKVQRPLKPADGAKWIVFYSQNEPCGRFKWYPIHLWPFDPYQQRRENHHFEEGLIHSMNNFPLLCLSMAYSSLYVLGIPTGTICLYPKSTHHNS